MNLDIRRVQSDNEGFLSLVVELDKLLAELNGSAHGFYACFSNIDSIKHCIVATLDGLPVGCGALRHYNEEAAEVKRMFVLPEVRGQKVGAMILTEIESWTKELGYNSTILETSKRLLPAINLYTRSGYEVIPNFGQYACAEDSVCMRKELRD